MIARVFPAPVDLRYNYLEPLPTVTEYKQMWARLDEETRMEVGCWRVAPTWEQLVQLANEDDVMEVIF